MGQTDSQFKAFLRLLVDALNDVAEDPNDASKVEKLKRIIDNMQKSIED